MKSLVLALGSALAFANGANDNSKGVATLIGFGAASPRRALAWAPPPSRPRCDFCSPDRPEELST